MAKRLEKADSEPVTMEELRARNNHLEAELDKTTKMWGAACAKNAELMLQLEKLRARLRKQRVS